MISTLCLMPSLSVKETMQMRAVGTGDIIAPGGRKGECIDGGEAVRQSSVAGLYYKFSVMMSDSSSLNPPAAAMAINARPQNN